MAFKTRAGLLLSMLSLLPIPRQIRRRIFKMQGKAGDGLKARYELYVFVKTFSGSGWDDHLKYATHTDEFVEEFCRVRGDKYEICFTTSCPWWMSSTTCLRAQSARRPEGMSRFWANASRNRSKLPHFPRPPTPSATSSAPPSTASSSRSPLDDVDMNTQPAHAHDPDSQETIKAPGAGYQRRRHFRFRKSEGFPAKRGRTNSGNARRNAEAGSQIARSIDNLSAAVAQPIVTSEDPRYVDDVVRILQDKTLLPDNPRGRLCNARSYLPRVHHSAAINIHLHIVSGFGTPKFRGLQFTVPTKLVAIESMILNAICYILDDQYLRSLSFIATSKAVQLYRMTEGWGGLRLNVFMQVAVRAVFRDQKSDCRDFTER
ncbi:hypothetical protein R3P38DRAFT_3354922 [Favolaschia claudopus]|uniref:Uncharacterized protein n=1 Tax=Favolaschia claudopus TaxID=2862362 RepID=A0AAW0BKX8_9AGAR